MTGVDRGTAETPEQNDERPLLPVEVEVYIEADGTVTFADLEAGMLPVAHELNPDESLACHVPPAGHEEQDEND